MSDQPTDVFSDYASMQIRSVPAEVRKFYNELAHAQDCTLGELMIRIAQGRAAVPAMGGGRVVQPQQNQDRLPALAQAAQALAHVAQASGMPIPKRTAASLNAAIAAEVRLMRGLSAPQRQLALPAPDSGA